MRTLSLFLLLLLSTQLSYGQVNITNLTKYEIDIQIQELTQELQLENINICVLYSQRKDVNGYVVMHQQGYYIFVKKKLKKIKIKNLIRHEMKHVHQYANGHLKDINKEKVEYLGQVYNLQMTPYLQRKHEIDAIKFEKLK